MNVRRGIANSGGPSAGMSLEDRVKFYRTAYRQALASTAAYQAPDLTSLLMGGSAAIKWETSKVGAYYSKLVEQAREWIGLYGATQSEPRKHARVQENIKTFISVWKQFIFSVEGRKIFAAREAVFNAQFAVIQSYCKDLEDAEKRLELLLMLAKACSELKKLCPTAEYNKASSSERRIVLQPASVLRYYILNSEPNKHQTWSSNEEIDQLRAIAYEPMLRQVRLIGEILQCATATIRNGNLSDVVSYRSGYERSLFERTPAFPESDRDIIHTVNARYDNCLYGVLAAIRELHPLTRPRARSRSSSLTLSHRQRFNYCT